MRKDLKTCHVRIFCVFSFLILKVQKFPEFLSKFRRSSLKAACRDDFGKNDVVKLQTSVKMDVGMCVM